MTIHCPCCHQPIEGVRMPVEALSSTRLLKRQRTIVAALAQAYPHPVEIADLVDATYGADPDGGPDLADKAVRSAIAHIRQRLKEHGWAVSKGSRRRYRLEPIA